MRMVAAFLTALDGPKGGDGIVVLGAAWLTMRRRFLGIYGAGVLTEGPNASSRIIRPPGIKIWVPRISKSEICFEDYP